MTSYGVIPSKIYRLGLLAAAACLGGLSAAPGTAQADPPMTVLTENYPPLNYLDAGELKGPAVEIVQAIMDRLHIKQKIVVRPWARAYNRLENKTHTALFSTTRSAARESRFKWVGPLAEKKIGMFVRRDSAITLSDLNAARPYTIGVQLAGVGMEELKAKGFENLDPSSTPIANLKKLLKGRIDMWYASNATVGGNAKQLGISVDALKLAVTTANTFMYIAVNKSTPDAVVERWQAVFDALYADGTIKEIFRRHELLYLYPNLNLAAR